MPLSGPLELTPSEMYGEDNQLNIIKKPFEINMKKLNSEFDSEKNKGRREQHRKTHNKEEKHKELITKKRITKATQITTQPPTRDGDELGSDTTINIYIYIDYIYIYI